MSIYDDDTVSISKLDLWILLTGYIRYAMHRRSTAPSIARDLLIQHHEALTPSQLQQLYDDVQVELRCGYSVGDPCDTQTWQTIATKLLHWVQERKEKGLVLPTSFNASVVQSEASLQLRQIASKRESISTSPWTTWVLQSSNLEHYQQP